LKPLLLWLIFSDEMLWIHLQVPVDVLHVSGDKSKDGSGGEVVDEVQGFVFTRLK